MNLTSVDKVSTLTQTEDLELGHTVELGCNINVEHRDNKTINISEQINLPSGERLMEHLHLLNHTSEHSQVPSISVSNKNNSVSNLTSESNDCKVIDYIDLTSESNKNKQVPSIYPRIVSKLNSCSSQHIVPSVTRSDLPSQIDAQKQITDSMQKSTTNSLNNDERLASMFIKQEDFENSINQKIVRTIRSIGNTTKKRKLQCTDEDSDKINKEVKQSSHKDLELDDCMEEVACYKCKFCPFLTLEKKGVALHVRLAHHSKFSGSEQEGKQTIKCPGCKLVFFTSKSLKLHLSQDHLVGSEELRTLVDSVMKFHKAKNKERRKYVVKNQSSAIPTILNGEICDNKEPSGECVQGIRDLPISELPVDECSKIRVRNLNTETLPELSEELPSTEVLQTNETRDGDISNGAIDEVREGTLVIDDDPLLQQKRNCEFQVSVTVNR